MTDEDQMQAEELSEFLNGLAAQFDELCAERHRAGEEEYGSLTFLGNDVIRMMLEELADTTNYCRMQAIKLMMLQVHLEELLSKEDSLLLKDNQIGFKSFKGVKDVGWGKLS